MKITLDMSISALLDAFDREFGASLGIYKGAYKSDDIKLFEIADPRKNPKSFIVVDKDTSVETVESMFKKVFGIRVQVKDKYGNTMSQESTLGGERILSKKSPEERNIKLVDLTDDIVIEKDKNEIELNKDNKKNKKAYYLKPKEIKHNVEDKIKEIDEYYLKFQKSERYKAMINLLSCIEEAKLYYPESKEIIEHIEDIKNKSVSISRLSVRKRRFAAIILIIITSALIFISVGIFGFNLYKKIKQDRTVDSIVKEIDNLRMRKGSLMESGNIAEANAIDESINSKSEQLNIIRNTKTFSIVYYSMLAVSIMFVILSIFILRLNKFYITSIRFEKETWFFLLMFIINKKSELDI